MTNLPTTPGKADLAELIDKLKREAPPVKRGRLIFALDATASREPTWDRACHIQSEMFEATRGLGGLETQLVYYRGYDECRSSKWLASASELHRVMRSVSCLGGLTQINRVLEHALRMAERSDSKIGALVFVGDAQEEEPDHLCYLAGQLGAAGVPLFLLQEGNRGEVASCFKQMAALSKGAYLTFDLSSIDKLKELLGGIAVYVSGGISALERYAKLKGSSEMSRITSQLKR
jgi:hypothetical protein